jgi:hypothetical protein
VFAEAYQADVEHEAGGTVRSPRASIE